MFPILQNVLSALCSAYFTKVTCLLKYLDFQRNFNNTISVLLYSSRVSFYGIVDI